VAVFVLKQHPDYILTGMKFAVAGNLDPVHEAFFAVDRPFLDVSIVGADVLSANLSTGATAHAKACGP
jgi:hypothetical protein